MTRLLRCNPSTPRSTHLLAQRRRLHPRSLRTGMVSARSRSSSRLLLALAEPFAEALRAVVAEVYILAQLVNPPRRIAHEEIPSHSRDVLPAPVTLVHPHSTTILSPHSGQNLGSQSHGMSKSQNPPPFWWYSTTHPTKPHDGHLNTSAVFMFDRRASSTSSCEKSVMACWCHLW